MKPFIIALTLYLFVNISSCSTNDAPIVEPPNGETAGDHSEGVQGIVAHNCKHDRTSR